MKKFAKATSMGLLAASILAAAGAANAANVVGGGASLPDPLYQEIISQFLNLPTTGNTFSYDSVGSGRGKSGFFTNDASKLVTGKTGSVHFAGSDSAVSLLEKNAYTFAENNPSATNGRAAGKWGPFIQIPAVATSVVLPYKKNGVTALDLSRKEVCQIFSYDPAARDWSQVGGGAYGSGPIEVVYRADNSGTTELFSQFLNAECVTHGITFNVSNNFNTVVTAALANNGTTLATLKGVVWFDSLTVPGHSSSEGVKATVAAGDKRLGYLSPDSDYLGSDNTKVSKIGGELPDNLAIQAVYTALPTPKGASAADQLQWVSAYSLPVAGKYPIYGTTNLLVGQCYKDPAVQTAVKNFLADFYNGVYDAQVIAHNFIPLPEIEWKRDIKANFLAVSGSLAIGDASVCNGIGRP